MRIGTDGASTFINLPPRFAGSNAGPGVATDGGGNVWVTSLMSESNSLIRFARGSSTPEAVQVLPRPECNGLSCVGFDASNAVRHMIHMAFSSSGGRSSAANVMYVLTSSLLDSNADEAVFVIEFEDDWYTRKPDGEVGEQNIWLPEDHSAAHRLQVVRPAAGHRAVDTFSFNDSANPM